MNTGGIERRWRPAEVGIALIIGSAVGAVLWYLTAVFLLGWTSDETCESRMDPPAGQKARASVQWFPLKSMCSAGDDTLSLTSPVVTLLWTIAAAVLIGAAAVGVALLIYSAIIQASRITDASSTAISIRLRPLRQTPPGARIETSRISR